MTVELKAGSLSDFFASAKETAKEIDEGKKLTSKNIIWVAPSDLMAILKPERTKLVQYLRKKKGHLFRTHVCDASHSRKFKQRLKNSVEISIDKNFQGTKSRAWCTQSN